MFDRSSIYHLIDYREMILALTLGLREGFLSIGGGFGIIYRGLASVLDYPIQIAIGSMSIYGLLARLATIKLFSNAGLIDIRQSLYFMPASLIGGALGSYVALTLTSQYFTLVIGIILTIMGINYFKPLFRGSGWMDRFSHHTYDKYIGYIVLIMSEAVTVVVGGGSMLSNHIFKHFYDIGPLKTSGIRTISMLGRSCAAISTFYLAGVYDMSLIIRCIVLGIAPLIIGTKYILGKGESFAEMIVGYMSLIFGIIMIIKYIGY